MNQPEHGNESSGAGQASDGDARATSYEPGPLRVPVVREQIDVHKDLVEAGRVRVSKNVVHHIQPVETVLAHDEVAVERVPINVYVDQAPPVRQEGDTTIFPVVREVAVVTRYLLVVEEVRITRRRVETIDRQEIPVREERVDVERLVAPGSPASVTK
jgi:uncharacterized protein (TIGR02271 family)